jgi:hypothetical protein
VTTLVVPNWSYGRLSAEKLGNALGGANADGVLAEYVALKENAVCKFPVKQKNKGSQIFPMTALNYFMPINFKIDFYSYSLTRPED